jgi:uncharacterized protein
VKDEARLRARLEEMVRASPRVMAVLAVCRDLALPDWRLVAGAVNGTVFNALTGRHPDHGIKDYDIAYFDPDISWDAEDIVIRRVAAALPDELRPLVEVRNQARVHLWFEARFGAPYAPLSCTDEALERYLCFSDAVAVRLEPDGKLDIAAPFGLEDVFAMRMRANPGRGQTPNRIAKAAAAQARWPEIVFEG